MWYNYTLAKLWDNINVIPVALHNEGAYRLECGLLAVLHKSEVISRFNRLTCEALKTELTRKRGALALAC